jgi:hypothetical protein
MAEIFKEIDYNSIVDVQDIMDNFNILRLAINNISLTDTEITVVAKKKMLNLVLKELEDSIKLVSDDLEQLELKDTAIDVVAEEKKLNVVLSELRSKDIEQSADILNLKNELNGYVARHTVANDNIQKSIND